MFIELDITSNFTFLTGGSHAEEYIRRAALLSMPAIAIADENSVAGIVRAHTEAREIFRSARLRADADADPVHRNERGTATHSRHRLWLDDEEAFAL